MGDKKSSKEIAFKDFKKSIGKLEFQAVLFVARKEYEKMEKIVVQAELFHEKTMSSLDDLVGDEDSIEYRASKKMIIGLAKQARKQVSSMFSEHIEGLDHLTDFINRFQKPGEELPYLNFDFTKQ